MYHLSQNYTKQQLSRRSPNNKASRLVHNQEPLGLMNQLSVVYWGGHLIGIRSPSMWCCWAWYWLPASEPAGCSNAPGADFGRCFFLDQSCRIFWRILSDFFGHQPVSQECWASYFWVSRRFRSFVRNQHGSPFWFFRPFVFPPLPPFREAFLQGWN